MASVRFRGTKFIRGACVSVSDYAGEQTDERGVAGSNIYLFIYLFFHSFIYFV